MDSRLPAAFISLWLSQAFVGVTDNIEIIFLMFPFVSITSK